jgi:Flp pilus assembly protein TadG
MGFGREQIKTTVVMSKIRVRSHDMPQTVAADRPSETGPEKVRRINESIFRVDRKKEQTAPMNWQLRTSLIINSDVQVVLLIIVRLVPAHLIVSTLYRDDKLPAHDLLNAKIS